MVVNDEDNNVIVGMGVVEATVVGVGIVHDRSLVQLVVCVVAMRYVVFSWVRICSPLMHSSA